MREGEPARDRDGDPKGELERLVHLARLADLGRLAASVAHEISTPLASITLRAESLVRSAQDPALQAIEAFKNFPRYLKSITEEALRCKEILTRLQDFARPPGEEARPVDLNGLADRAAQLLHHEMMRHRVALEFHPAPDLPQLVGWERSLGQAILALLVNAMERSPEGGKVTLVTARKAVGLVSVSVKDDGPGVAPEHRERIFDPFFSTKAPGTGAGLGLTICRRVAATHGGEVTVESEPGQGSRFVLSLAVREAPSGGAEATRS